MVTYKYSPIGAALVEFIIIAIPTLIIFVAILDLGKISREQNVVLEAAKSAARAGSGQAIRWQALGAFSLTPADSGAITCQYEADGSLSMTLPHNIDIILLTAVRTACTYIFNARFKSGEWAVSASTSYSPAEACATFPLIKVSVSALTDRTVSGMRTFFDVSWMRPASTATFPVDLTPLLNDLNC